MSFYYIWGVPKKIRDDVKKTEISKFIEKISIGFYEEGYLVILKPKSLLVNLIFNFLNFSDEYNKVPYTILRENLFLFFIEDYMVIASNKDLLRSTIDHLKGRRVKERRFYRKDFPENVLFYGAHIKDGLFFKSEKFIFYHNEVDSLNILIEKPSHLVGNILKKIEPDLNNSELPPNHIFYISFKNFSLSEEIENSIKGRKDEKLVKFFKERLHFFKNIVERFTFSFKGFNYFVDYYFPLFLIKIGKGVVVHLSWTYQRMV
ncbi:MAG: hypothetical protein ABDH49_02310 [Candidatus Hydrothermales bacterium]